MRGLKYAGRLVVEYFTGSHPTGVRGLKFKQSGYVVDKLLSHPTGVRGLKSVVPVVPWGADNVAPHWGAWIEICYVVRGHIGIASHPTGVRGLKSIEFSQGAADGGSHPTGVRGLKYTRVHLRRKQIIVAPHWGAWIEIQSWKGTILARMGRTPLGCVD